MHYSKSIKGIVLKLHILIEDNNEKCNVQEPLLFLVSFLYPQHTMYVEGYIGFVFRSVCPFMRVCMHPSGQVLKFCIEVLCEVFFCLLLFLTAYTLI